METIKHRDEIAPEYKWRLEDLYPDQAAWEADFQKVQEKIQAVTAFEGKLKVDTDILLAVLNGSEALDRNVERLYVYARMRRDEDNSNAAYQALFERAQMVATDAASAVAFLIPELLGLEAEALLHLVQTDAELKRYAFFFAELLRSKEHVLSPAEEKILAMGSDMAGAAQQIFTMLNNADITFPSVIDEDGQEVEITKGRYSGLMESKDRTVRENTFAKFYSSYGKLINTIGTSLSSNIKREVFYARVRKYPSCLASSLDADNVPLAVYDQLIASVHANLDQMERYMDIRKRMLKLDKIHMYDIYTPLVPDYKKQIPYVQGKQIVLEALAPLGKDYTELLQKAYTNGWIDVYENQGKTSGAYSWGCYDSNPYVLMNYENKLDDVFTLAHELGHSLHSYYSDQAQPYVYSQYPIFLAEVASTVNESLLIDYLLQKSSSREEKMYLLNHYLEQFRGTVYRQTMFAEFEKIVHELFESGEALIAENFSEIYLDLNRKYYGAQVVLDGEIRWEWARIPHFYTAFYVYKYATGFSAATAIKEQIVQEGVPAVTRYREFLKAGGSDYPIITLQKAGVDLTTPEPVNQALSYFKRLLDEMEALI